MAVRYRATITVPYGGGALDLVHHNFPNTSVGGDNIYTAQNPNTVIPAFATQPAVNSSLRAFPLQSICDNIKLSINNSSNTWNSRQTLSPLLRLLPRKLLENNEACPVRPDDQFALLSDGQGSCHPQSTSERSFGAYSRNACRPVSVGLVGNNYVYVYDITEPLIVPGINTLFDNEPYLANVNNLSLIMTFGSGALNNDFYSGSQLFTLAAPPVQSVGYTGAPISVALTDAHLILQYVTANPMLVSIPKSVVYNYELVNYTTQSLGQISMQALVNTSAVSQTVRFFSLPKKICFFIRLPISTRQGTGYAAQVVSNALVPEADAALALQDLVGCVSISLGARNGLLANCSRSQIWQLCKEAGSTQTYDDFANGSGAWVVLDPITAFGIDTATDLLPGENGSLNFMVTVQYTNKNAGRTLGTTGGLTATCGMSDAVVPELVIVPIYEGTMTITPDSAMYSVGVLTDGEVSSLMSSGTTVNKEAIQNVIAGAGLYSDKTVLMKAPHGKGRGGVLSMA
jgi:hypothetical protein